MVEHSAVNYTAEHHKPLFWRRLATKLSPLLVPQLCPAYPEQMVRIGSMPANSPISHSAVDCHFSEYATNRALTSTKHLNRRTGSREIGRYYSNYAVITPASSEAIIIRMTTE